MLNIVILSISFLISTVISLKLQKQSKWKSLASIIIVNILIIGTYFLIFNYLDEEARLFGYSQSNYYLAIFLIPVVIWLNFIILTIMNRD